MLRPTNKMSWIGYANACHLVGDYDMALNIIKDFRKNNRVNFILNLVGININNFMIN